MTEHWYRFDSYNIAPSLDEWENPIGEGDVGIYLRTFKVVRYTPKGVWLDLDSETERFVLIDANKRFACPTVDDAEVSFHARKKKYLRILEARATDVRKLIAKADKLIDEAVRNNLMVGHVNSS